MASNRLVYRYQLAVRKCLKRERVFRDRLNPFDAYDDKEMQSKFGFHRTDIVRILELIETDIEHMSTRRGSLPALTQLLIVLRFYATGCFQQVVGDIFGIDRSTVSRVLVRVSGALADKLNEFVHLPSRVNADKMMEKFYTVKQFPQVIGCIDCTHIRIIAPSQFEDAYVDRKGQHSINCLLVCDADMLIINCVVRWPGSTDDARILCESKLHEVFQRSQRPLRGIFLADSGYPLKEWLMTPFIHPATAAEEAYNAAHCSTRQVIKRTIGVLKKRWHCLQGVLRHDPGQACRIIMACIVLHNMAVSWRSPEPVSDADPCSSESDSDGESDHMDTPPQPQALSGCQARQSVVDQYFSH